MSKTFYSNGKLLITGEYVVLDGAMAFALPTKFGQSLTIENGANKAFYWKSFDVDGSVWFEDTISFEAVIKKEVFANAIKNKLVEILHEAYNLNSDFIKNSDGYKVETSLTFPRNWGLGTSSTLLNNIAQWLEIDAFELLNKSFGGSGYDIACAQNNSGILYQLENNKPIVTNIDFNPNFTENIYFVYSNRKQNSRDAIANYYKKRFDLSAAFSEIDAITKTIIKSKTIEEFIQLVEKHEVLLSAILEQKTVKQLYFTDFDGTIKSLGAWGGDFVMAISKENPAAYFKAKGFETILPYSKMIL
jgi:mevalonate kinase